MPLWEKNRIGLSLNFSLLKIEEVLEGENECTRNVSIKFAALISHYYNLLYLLRIKSFSQIHHQKRDILGRGRGYSELFATHS